MDFISNKQPQINEMLRAIGVDGIDELYSAVPAHLKLPPPSEDDGLSEWEGMRLMEGIAALNTFPEFKSYLGGGAYEHHVPALVGAVCSKSEFLTSYTPYQPEASQGMLQAIFEFQSAICALTRMDVANASVYDGASACAEAVLMALRFHKERKEILIAESLHPHYRQVVEQYLSTHDVSVKIIPFDDSGKLTPPQVSTNTAAILIQSPNFLGIIEDVAELARAAKKVSALTIVCANPLACGLFEPCGDLGADIAVGDCQPLGLPLQFGGPYCGYMACKEQFVRQLPGRIVGQTVDAKGQRGYVLTLQAREQHIRREKATSNICTNQALAALASLVAMLWYGKEGLRQLALANFQRTAYLRDHLSKIPGVSVLSGAPIFNEFAVKFPKVDKFRKEGIASGIDLGRFYPRLKGYLLVAVTETKTLQDLDHYIQVARQL